MTTFVPSELLRNRVERSANNNSTQKYTVKYLARILIRLKNRLAYLVVRPLRFQLIPEVIMLLRRQYKLNLRIEAVVFFLNTYIMIKNFDEQLQFRVIISHMEAVV